MGAGADSVRFSMIGDRLRMVSAGSDTAYTANITARGDSIFGHSNWNEVEVTLDGAGHAEARPTRTRVFDALGAPPQE